MDFLFELSIGQGLAFTILFVCIAGFVVVWLVRKIIATRLNKQHNRVGRLLFRVSAGLLGLLISLSYANERVEYNRVRDSLEEEASLITNIYIKLRLHNTPEADTIGKELIKYVTYVVEDDWENAIDDPYFSDITKSIVNVYNQSHLLPATSEEQLQLKNEIRSELNQVTKLMQTRFYSRHALIPYLIYILGVGVVFMWIFFSVYNLEVITFGFLTLYNVFIAVLIYFIIMLSNPLVGSLKMDAHAFTILKTKGFDRAPK